jgi:hypothetical protein
MASAAFGCSGAPEGTPEIPRVAVSGEVTLDGKPLPGGKIEFVPLGSQSAETAVADIEDGRYSIIRAVGPSPGKHKVKISSRKSVKIAEGQEPGGGPNKKEPEKIPKKYNAQTTLEVDIPAGGSVDLKFDMQSKP